MDLDGAQNGPRGRCLAGHEKRSDGVRKGRRSEQRQFEPGWMQWGDAMMMAGGLKRHVELRDQAVTFPGAGGRAGQLSWYRHVKKLVPRDWLFLIR
jgi:hypothetical protein